MTTEQSSLHAARAYCDRGYAVVPVPHAEKGPRISGWQHLRLGPDDLAKHFNGTGNIGLLLGEPSGGLVDVDLDCPEAIELADRFLPPTSAMTGRASKPRSHRWYVCPGVSTRQFKDPVTKEMIVELRSTGVQTVVGPSLHPDGERYDTLEGQPAVVSPAALMAGVEALYNAVLAQRGWKPEPPEPPRPRPDGPRRRASPDDHARAAAYLDRMPESVSGQGGHDRLYAAATAMVHGFGLDADAAMHLLRDRFNPRCQPPWTERELMHKVDDAVNKPHDRPYGWLRDARAQRRAGEAGDPPELEPLTDLGNSERFTRSFAEHVRYSHATGVWFTWDGRRWKEDDRGLPTRLAGTMARQIAAEAGTIDNDGDREKAIEWARKCESRGRIESTVALARSQEGCAIGLDELDRDPWRFNALNGTIDLRTGQLGPHRRDDLITRLAPVNYDPDAACPRFDAFLNRAFAGDEELIGYVLRLLGMALTGDITEQVLPIFHGAGANGKSVLVDTVAGIMGDYAGDAPPYLLVESRRDEHPTEIADLRGRRLVVASETEDNASLKMQLVKKLTGDAKLKGRKMRQDYFSFDRTHKTLLVTNHPPRVRERSEAVWRRLRLIPFHVVIPEHERDPRLLEKLRAEWPGVLARLVRGCLEWQRDGLGCPDAVRLATTDYRTDEDSVGRWLEACCTTDALGEGSGLFTPWRDILGSCAAWCEAQGERPIRERTLAHELTQRGFPTGTRRIDGQAVRGRRGLTLRPEPRP